MKRITCGLLVLASACAPRATPPATPTPAAAPRSAAAEVTAIADDYMARAVEESPELVTYLGLPGKSHGGLTDNSPEALAASDRREDEWAARLARVDSAAVGEGPERLTYGFLRQALESARQSRVCRGELWAVSQLTGWQTQYPFLASIQPVGTPELRDQALARFRQLPRFIDNETGRLRTGLAQGYSSPRLNVRRVIEQLDGLIAPAPAQSPFFAAAQRDSTPEFRRAWEALIASEINPALRRHRDFLRDEYLPAAREAIAVSTLPNGAECYRAQVRAFTTLELDPRQIHQTGLEQIARIDAEMLAIARRSFATSDVPALLTAFRTERRYGFQTRQEIIDFTTRAMDRARREMPKWFGRMPRADVVIEPYREFEEKSAPLGSYDAPAEDGSRPGIYHINTYEPEKQTRVGAESTAFHEAIPGHHLQLAIAQERKDAHPLTRFLGNSGFSEGWGLYAERLADEMGLFSSDLDRMGLLSNEALRAARMVVDPGMHVLGWTRQQAIDYMLAHTAETRGSIEDEVDRYIVWPGQATAYMVGSLEIMRLRDLARRELGPRFDIRVFHDKVLEDGTVTLPMLREKIQRWVTQARQPR
ncbi:MAG: protein of unknown function DUF885 [uncultured Gemmatimonadetes bacterium]|uniref:DUF885 domain-containing protein n=1 Tax=uncultured Gemmatimonadota bacterium TaxID=203437 RepID=A0A6J4KJ36_9BACT|nr:MAG: protein of unknown function DUF885 [uncultured Gemmatimonadota bacterium]